MTSLLKDIWIKDGFNHHAYLLAGGAEVAGGLLEELHEVTSEALAESSDHIVTTYAQFGIDESRSLKAQLSRRALSGQRFVVLSIEQITPEAQNALLKITEEPTANTTIFLLVADLSVILPTLKSRFIVLQSKATSSQSLEDAEEFVQATYGERMAVAGKMSAKAKTDEEKRQQRKEANMFMDHLDEYYHGTQDTQLLKALLTAREHLSSRELPVKAVLEYLALALPKG